MENKEIKQLDLENFHYFYKDLEVLGLQRDSEGFYRLRATNSYIKPFWLITKIKDREELFKTFSVVKRIKYDNVKII